MFPERESHQSCQMLLGKQVRGGLELSHLVILLRADAVGKWELNLFRIEEEPMAKEYIEMWT